MYISEVYISLHTSNSNRKKIENEEKWRAQLIPPSYPAITKHHFGTFCIVVYIWHIDLRFWIFASRHYNSKHFILDIFTFFFFLLIPHRHRLSVVQRVHFTYIRHHSFGFFFNFFSLLHFINVQFMRMLNICDRKW